MIAKTYVQKQIHKIEGRTDKQAAFAKLRKGVGKSMAAYPEVFQTVFSDYPDDEISPDAEEAIYIALTMYGIHKTGHTERCMHKEGVHIATAIAQLGDKHSKGNLTMQMNAMLKARDLPSFCNYLQRFVRRLSAAGQPFDYGMLVDDLYYYHFSEQRDRIRLKWNREFVRNMK